jgi:hypothetical protein
MSIGQAFGSGWVWYLVVVCILQAIGVYGLSFWLPTMLKEIGSDLLISDRCEWSGVIAKLFAESMRPTRKAG